MAGRSKGEIRNDNIKNTTQPSFEPAKKIAILSNTPIPEMIIEGYTALIAETESHRIDKPENNVVNRVELEQLITRVSERDIHLYTADATQIL